MASIPLPALDVKPPQPQQDPVEQYGRLAQLRNMLQNAPVQHQILQQQAEAGQQENQQRQISLNDQKAMTQAMQQWDGKDVNSLIPLVMKNGASANAVMGLKQKVLEQQKTYSDIAKSDSETGKNQLDTMKGKNDMIAGALGNVMNMPDEQVAQGLTQTAQGLLQKGLIDPQHAQLAAQLAQSGNAQAIRQQLGIMQKGLMSESQQMDSALKNSQAQKATADANAKQAEVDFYKNPNGATGAPGVPVEAVQQADWLRKHPGKGPADFAVSQAAAKAGAEERARMPGEMALAAQRQALSQGDPQAAGQLLVNGDATLAELKSRGATPDFIAKTLFAANRLSGGKYNAQQSEAQFDVAKSPANVAFFGSAKSLTDKGGTLDQLADAAKAIPGNQIPVFNTIADAAKAATGSGPVAKYASLLLGVSDDYSKVMGGGQGSDSSRNQALHLVPANASPEARAAAIEGIRGAVGSQLNSRIGDNPVMKRMYGGNGAAQGGQTTQPGSSGLGVKLSDAMALPQNRGKSAQQVMQDIQAHGHTVIQ